MADPTLLTTDVNVRFPGDADIVTVVQVEQGPFWEFVYRAVVDSGPIRAVERAEAQHDYSTWCVRQRRGASSARPECKGT